MKKILIIAAIVLLVFTGCNDNKPATNDYCVVKGTVKGVKEGKTLELSDAFNDWVVVGQGVIKDGVFEIHPEVTAPTHVYLYVHNGKQLKDFILEPGTILVEVDATDEYDYETGAKGTPSNDLDQIIISYRRSGNQAAADSVVNNPANRYVLVDFWASWCDGCLDVMPQIKEIYEKYHDKGLEIYDLSDHPFDRLSDWRNHHARQS